MYRMPPIECHSLLSFIDVFRYVISFASLFTRPSYALHDYICMLTPASCFTSFRNMQGLLQCKDSPPLFKVIVALNGNDMVVSPALPEVDKLLTKAVRNMAESAKFFVRWMYGTCLKTEPQIINEDEEPYVFSFFQDISKNPQVVKLILSLTSQTNKVYNMTNKYLDGWRRYDKVTGLWNPKRKQQIEKLRPTCANLDSGESKEDIS